MQVSQAAARELTLLAEELNSCVTLAITGSHRFFVKELLSESGAKARTPQPAKPQGGSRRMRSEPSTRDVQLVEEVGPFRLIFCQEIVSVK